MSLYLRKLPPLHLTSGSCHWRPQILSPEEDVGILATRKALLLLESAGIQLCLEHTTAWGSHICSNFLASSQLDSQVLVSHGDSAMLWPSNKAELQPSTAEVTCTEPAAEAYMWILAQASLLSRARWFLCAEVATQQPETAICRPDCSIRMTLVFILPCMGNAGWNIPNKSSGYVSACLSCHYTASVVYSGFWGAY